MNLFVTTHRTDRVTNQRADDGRWLNSQMCTANIGTHCKPSMGATVAGTSQPCHLLLLHAPPLYYEYLRGERAENRAVGALWMPGRRQATMPSVRLAYLYHISMVKEYSRAAYKTNCCRTKVTVTRATFWSKRL